ncbi:MAG: hypothetical protein Q9160_006458 [Pyrenula sp. 1 TL-2023]
MFNVSRFKGVKPLRRYIVLTIENHVENQAAVLPSWLTNILSPPIPPSQEPHPTIPVKEQDSITDQKGSDKTIGEVYAESLQDVHDVEALRELIQRLEISLHQNKQYVRQPLRLMLDGQWPLDQVRTFLFDHFFENRISKKWREIYWYLSSNVVAEEKVHTLLNLSVEGIRLGVIEPCEIKDLIRLLPQIKIGKTVLGKLSAISEWYSKIVGAIDSSRVIRLRFLGAGFRRWFIRKSISAPFSPETPSILWKICQESRNSDRSFPISLAKWLQRRSIDAEDGDVSGPLSAVLKIFCQINRNDLVKGAVDCSTFLISHSTSVPFGEGHLQAWIEQVSLLRDRVQISESITQSRQIDCCFGVEKNIFRASRQQTTLIQIWTLKRLGCSTNDLRLLVERFWKEVQESASPSSIPLCDLITSIQSLGLPTTEIRLLLAICSENLPLPEDGVFQYPEAFPDSSRSDNDLPSQAISFHQLQTFAKSQVLSLKPIYAFADNESWWCLSKNLQPLLKLLSERVNESFDTFVRTGRYLIFQDSFAALMITRMLRFNLSFRIALSMSPGCHAPGTLNAKRHITIAKYALKWQNQDQEGGKSASEYKNSPEVKEYTLTPNGALETIEALAAACAISPVLTPRQAFRRVWQFYYILRRYRAPLRPFITRCLWHAGVTRYGKQGCSTTQYNWILQQVDRVEGRQRAENLSGTGKHYLMRLDDSNCSVDDEVDRDTLTEAQSWLTSNHSLAGSESEQKYALLAENTENWPQWLDRIEEVGHGQMCEGSGGKGLARSDVCPKNHAAGDANSSYLYTMRGVDL